MPQGSSVRSMLPVDGPSARGVKFALNGNAEPFGRTVPELSVEVNGPVTVTAEMLPLVPLSPENVRLDAMLLLDDWQEMSWPKLSVSARENATPCFVPARGMESEPLQGLYESIIGPVAM